MDAAVVVLAACFAAPAPGPGPFDAPSGPRPLKDEAHEFASRLLTAADALSARYIRPVAREKLLAVGLTAMYARAQMPVPKGLGDALKEAAAGNGAPVSADDLEMFTEADKDSASKVALTTLIQHARENLGEVKELDGRDVRVVYCGRDGLAACCGAMAQSLDAYSGVVTRAEQRRNLGEGAECASFGFEVRDFSDKNALVVKSVAHGGPAQRAGIRPGEMVTHLDGKAVAETGPAELHDLVRWCADPDLIDKLVSKLPLIDESPIFVPQLQQVEPSQPLKVTIRRRATEPRVVVLEPAHFRPETILGVSRRDDNAWDYWLDRNAKLAHLRIALFDHGTAAELLQVVSRLRDAGACGVVLDLRWCPGGFLDEAVGGARIFLDEGVVATVKARDKEDQVYRSDGTGAIAALPLVVLVNGETSGGAELLAAALQDHGRAVVVGQRTRGKASIQTSFPVTGAPIVLKVTNGEFVRPSGKSLHRGPDARASDDWGVRPDDGLESRVSAELAASLKADWQRQTLRPGGDLERLPMDDLDGDPQLQAAVEALKARLK